MEIKNKIKTIKKKKSTKKNNSTIFTKNVRVLFAYSFFRFFFLFFGVTFKRLFEVVLC